MRLDDTQLSFSMLILKADIWEYTGYFFFLYKSTNTPVSKRDLIGKLPKNKLEGRNFQGDSFWDRPLKMFIYCLEI